MDKVEWRRALPILLLLLAFVSSTQPVSREGSAGTLPPDDLTHDHNTPPDDVTQRHFAPRDVRGRHEGHDHTPFWHDGPAAGGDDDVVQTTDDSTGGDDEGLKNRTLRIAVFSDPTLLHLLAAQHPLHPPTATHRYITTLVSAVENLLQQGVGASPKLQLQLVQVGVWAAKEAVPFRTEGPSGGTLHSFCKWVSQRRAARGHPDYWHHAMLLSGTDLFESTQAPLGTTYVGGLCHPDASCSVVEAQSFKAVYIAAHELAHSMGVPHDGAPDAANCPKEGFLMGQSLTQTSFRWSSCSKDAFPALLKKDRCLEVSQGDGKIAGVHELDLNSGKLPGQMYPADEQCRLALGQEYKATPSKMSVCDYLTCTDGLRTQGVHPALEGTACGNNHVCIAGNCQEHRFPAAPPPPPPTGTPGFPTNVRPGEDSVFPPATIPGEVSSVPMPLRCSLLPPFLHAFIGCASPVSSPTEQEPSPPSARLLSLISIPASSRMGTLAVNGGLSGLQSRSTGDLQTRGEVSGRASRPSFRTLPDSSSSVSSSPRPATSSISTVTTSSTTVTASYPTVIATASDNTASPSTVTATPTSGIAPPSTVTAAASNDTASPSTVTAPASTVTTTASGDTASPSNVMAFPDDDLAPPSNSVINERENTRADGGNATTGYTDDETRAGGDKETNVTNSEDRKSAENETELQGAALAEYPDVETRNMKTEAEEDGGGVKGMDETMSSYQTTTDLSLTRNALTDKTPTDRSLLQQTNVSEGADRIAEFSLREFNVSGSGLNLALPLEFIRGLFTALFQPKATEGVSPSSKTATGKAAPSATTSTKEPASDSFSAHYRSAGVDAPLRRDHHRGTKPIRPALLQAGSSQEPILASTAPTHTRAARTASCSHTCGGGTRLVTQVCVEITATERQVSEELCNGLPNFVAPFYQSCNTLPCASPRWVTGPWGECSAWCGVGLQHRLVACGLPLLQDASPLAAGYFLPTRRCEQPQPRAVRLCSGPCLTVDCSLPENAFHPACYDLLQDTPLEQDHLP